MSSSKHEELEKKYNKGVISYICKNLKMLNDKNMPLSSKYCIWYIKNYVLNNTKKSLNHYALIGDVKNFDILFNKNDYKIETLFGAIIGNQTEIIKYLSHKKCNLNEKYDMQISKEGEIFGMYPLFFCSIINSYKCMKELINCGADPNLQIDEISGTNSLLLSAEYGNIECLRIVSPFCDINYTNHAGLNAIYATAANNASIECVDYLVKKGCDYEAEQKDGATPIFLAAQSGNNMFIKYFANKFIQERDYGKIKKLVNEPRKDGMTPCYIAAFKDNYETISLLHMYGANINATHDEGDTPLHIAASYGYIQSLKVLINLGAIIDQPMNYNNSKYALYTPLHLACEACKTGAVKELLNLGAKPYYANKKGETALKICENNGHKEGIELIHDWMNTNPMNHNMINPNKVNVNIKTGKREVNDAFEDLQNSFDSMKMKRSKR